MSKRGLSDIVTNVLIILLVLVAVSIIWMFLRPVIQGGAGELDGIGDTFRVSLEIVPSSVIVYDTNDIAEVTVKRNAGEGNVVGVGVVLEDDGGNSKMIKNYTVIEELGSGKLVVSFAGESLGTIVKISVVPIIGLSNGNERIGDIADSQIVGSSGGQLNCNDGDTQSCNGGFTNSTGNVALGTQACASGDWGACRCYSDCDLNTRINSTDSICYNAKLSSDPYKDCDKNGGFTTNDTLCFLNYVNQGICGTFPPGA